MAKQKDIAELTAQLMSNYRLDSQQAAELAVILTKLAKKLHSLSLTQSNIGLTDAQKLTKQRTRGRVKELLEAIGAQFECDGDPRGFMIYLTLPNGATNSWRGTWGIHE